MKITDKKLIDLLCIFFEPDPKKRESVDYFLTAFTNLKEDISAPKFRKTQFNYRYNWDSILPEILLFCKTKDLFY